MSTKYIYSVIGSFFTMFILGYLLYEVILSSYFAEMMQSMGDCIIKDPPVLAIILAHILLSIILTNILIKSGTNSFKSGVINSILFAVLLILWYDMWMFASFSFMTITIMIVDVLVNGLIIILAGGVIGFVLGKVK